MDRIVLAVLIGALALTGCFWKPDRWTAFVYPPGKSLDAEDAQKAIQGVYSTFEDCQSAAINSLRQHQALTKADDFGSYECGSDCRYEAGMDLYICKETRK